MHNEKISETWEYDGSFYGFLTVVYHAFSENKFPETILTSETAIESLFQSKLIETDERIAKKIYARLLKRLRIENSEFIINGFYCSLKEKDRYLLDAIKIGLTTKDLLTNHLGHPSILALQNSLKSLFGEVHLYTGFIRFEYLGELLYSKIAPKHLSLPFLCPHFAERYPNQTIMIYDETHHILALIEQGQISLIENSEQPVFDSLKNESEIQENWLTFLKAVTIDERNNEKVQLSHLPKRYRSNMIDFTSN